VSLADHIRGRRKEEMARGTLDARDQAARIFTCRGGRFVNCQKMEKRYGEMSFSLFPKKKMDGKGIHRQVSTFPVFHPAVD
jgi:hypothetical protein